MNAARKAVPIPTKSQHRKDAELESWICERLHLRDLFSGVTTTDIRRDRLKTVLLERGLSESIAGSREGKPVKWRVIYEDLYREEL